MRRLARLIDAVPAVGDALTSGSIGVAQALEIGRVLVNRRIGHLTTRIAPILLEQAEHLAFDDFRLCVDRFIMLADSDGSFDDIAANVEHRCALVTELGGALHVQASGGDPLTATAMTAIFERFVQRELRCDIEQRRAEHGDHADQHPLPRSAGQRSFDALQTIFELAAHAADGGIMPTGSFDTLVNVVCDQHTINDITAPAPVSPCRTGRCWTSTNSATSPSTRSTRLADPTTADPATLLDRRCETTSGTPVHPRLVLQALLSGHVRRVVVDSTGVVTELGRRQRLFTGAARDAAKLLTRTCTHPGCTIRSTFAQVDHIDNWTEHGATDQNNADIRCGPHNRFKHRQRWRTRRDTNGRTYSIRPDNTIVLPVGEHEPDLSIDELERITRQRIRALRPPEPATLRTSIGTVVSHHGRSSSAHLAVRVHPSDRAPHIGRTGPGHIRVSGGRWRDELDLGRRRSVGGNHPAYVTRATSDPRFRVVRPSSVTVRP